MGKHGIGAAHYLSDEVAEFCFGLEAINITAASFHIKTAMLSVSR